RPNNENPTTRPTTPTTIKPNRNQPTYTTVHTPVLSYPSGMLSIVELLLLIVGLAVGAALGWLAARSRSSAEIARLDATLRAARLRGPQVRGRWGEHQLRRIVEATGMLEHCDFSEQVAGVTDAGGVRPDLLVRLHGGRQVVVDAKAPFDAYLSAMEARDEAT